MGIAFDFGRTGLGGAALFATALKGAVEVNAAPSGAASLEIGRPDLGVAERAAVGKTAGGLTDGGITAAGVTWIFAGGGGSGFFGFATGGLTSGGGNGGATEGGGGAKLPRGATSNEPDESVSPFVDVIPPRSSMRDVHWRYCMSRQTTSCEFCSRNESANRAGDN